MTNVVSNPTAGVSPYVGDYMRSSRASARPAVHFASSSEQAGALEVKTAEGDTVAISFSALEALGADASGGNAHYGSAARASVSVQVNGNLSDQEVSDISKLMKQLAAAVGDVRSGDTGKLAQDLAGMQSLESLNGFRFAYAEAAQAQLSSTARSASSSEG